MQEADLKDERHNRKCCRSLGSNVGCAVCMTSAWARTHTDVPDEMVQETVTLREERGSSQHPCSKSIEWIEDMTFAWGWRPIPSRRGSSCHPLGVLQEGWTGSLAGLLWVIHGASVPWRGVKLPFWRVCGFWGRCSQLIITGMDSWESIIVFKPRAVSCNGDCRALWAPCGQEGKSLEETGASRASPWMFRAVVFSLVFASTRIHYFTFKSPFKNAGQEL